MYKNFHKNKYNRGVTLVELIVVIVIFVIMSGVVLFSHGQFRSSTSIQNLADDIALSIRKAQSYAIGVRGTDSIFDVGYGIHFAVIPVYESSFYLGSNKLFIIFTDIYKNNTYDYIGGLKVCGSPNKENECLEALSITSADYISTIYIGVDGKDEEIEKEATVDIVFNRPNPEPIFCYRKDGAKGGLGGPVTIQHLISAEKSSSCEETSISYVKIVISNTGDSTVSKTITIWNNGQISVS